MIYSKITATGRYLPKTILTNYDLEKQIETSHEWIVERTGIKQRHIATKEETTVFMATQAALQALADSGIPPEEIDMVVVATCTPDKVFPSTACLIQEALKIPPGIAFDVQAACSGFTYILSVADQFIRTGVVKRALLVGSEVMSRIVDWQDRTTCILFGDGAGAVLLEASTEPGILSTTIGADGRHHEALYVNNLPGATLQMQGKAVFRLAVNMLDKIAAQVLQDHQLSISDIDWLVPHQANVRIIKATAEKLGLPLEKVVLTIEEHGNTSGASIPIALDVAIRDGRIKRGQRLLFEAFGGGLTWGTALIKY
jgi:3-oxoacyl-[acyl-carrier-protein] synthase-3